MDWVPVVLITFKIGVLGTGMFFAVKWHYDQDNKAQKIEASRVFGKAIAIFVLLLLGVMFATFTLARMLGLELTYPR